MNQFDPSKTNSQKGISVEQLQNFCKNRGFDFTIPLSFCLASLSSILFSLYVWSLILFAVGGVIGSFASHSCLDYLRVGAKRFLDKESKETHLYMKIGFTLLFSLLLSPLYFLVAASTFSALLFSYKETCPSSECSSEEELPPK